MEFCLDGKKNDQVLGLPVLSFFLSCVFTYHVTRNDYLTATMTMTTVLLARLLWKCFVRGAIVSYQQYASLFACYLMTKRLVVQHERDTTQGPSSQLLSLLRIHGQHGNTVYNRGLKQESEQYLKSTVRNC